MEVRIEESWKFRLKDEFALPYFNELANFVRSEYSKTTVYPPAGRIFAAFDACPFDKVKAVILGQDPYHGYGQADGLCFSVSPKVKIPPSLVNIFKELKSDLEIPLPKSGNLTAWAKQGVLLLNATLTVRAGKPASHQNYGWEKFTDRIILELAQKNNLVFILWGASARKKAAIIDPTRHLRLESPHPSPLSAARGFFGSKPFSKTNVWLKKNAIEPINWNLN